ncbi:MAG: phosphoribulokinase [Hyphomicrobiaceae bacterium]|nr:phosphoribulokinase [Hyphomicrobiaceae bacterium]
MSQHHPIITVTGSSDRANENIRETFEHIFWREKVSAAFIDGSAYRRFDRAGFEAELVRARVRGQRPISHFGIEANLLSELEETFRRYGETGTGRTRHYAHSEAVALRHGVPTGTFTPWQPLPEPTDILLYEGRHGALVTDGIDIARHGDMRIGVVPVINLEWIEKIQRDKADLGYSTAAITDTILRRMTDYVEIVCPQFSHTDINFQRIPIVDTSNPFIARYEPTEEETMVVIRFRNPRGIDFPYLLSMIHDSFMSRANSIVIPGGKLDIAMQLILMPMILQLVERSRRARWL